MLSEGQELHLGIHTRGSTCCVWLPVQLERQQLQVTLSQFACNTASRDLKIRLQLVASYGIEGIARARFPAAWNRLIVEH